MPLVNLLCFYMSVCVWCVNPLFSNLKKLCIFLFISGTIQRREEIKELLEQWAGMVPSGPPQPHRAPHHIPGSALLRHREVSALATEGKGEVKVGPQPTEPLPENGILTVSSQEATSALCHLNLIRNT